jgi:endonuclease VIII
LFLSKINPFVAIKDIPLKVMKTLLQQIPSVLNIGYANAGMTRVKYRNIGEMADSNRKKWSDKHWVFRRGGMPCWNCMTRIVTDYKSSARVTFWCPKCQRQH